MIANLINRKKVFKNFFFDIGAVIILIISIFLLESKVGYLIFGIINILVFVILFNSKLMSKNFILMIISFIFLYIFYQIFNDKIEKAYGLIFNYEHPSFNIRANFALVSIYLMYHNPLTGIGLNNFKFYVEEGIYGLQSITWLNIKTEGKGLELDTYLYLSEKAMPDPANMILGIGAEIGIIALLIFLIFLLNISIKSFFLMRNKNLNKDEIVLSHFLFLSLIVVIISFSSFYQLYFLIQWIVIALNISFFYFIKKKYT